MGRSMKRREIFAFLLSQIRAASCTSIVSRGSASTEGISQARRCRESGHPALGALNWIPAERHVN
jgi:hypothetical protein